MKKHSVEKIGGTSMSDYAAVRDNIIFKPSLEDTQYQRIFVVSAYAGITDTLLEQKKTGKPGVFALFASAETEESWKEALEILKDSIHSINKGIFKNKVMLEKANAFIGERLEDTERVLSDLERLCAHGHFALEAHIETVKEMLASIGEAHSAWNMAHLLREEGINARFVDLTGWKTDKHISLDQRIQLAFENIDLERELPIVTGYAHAETGLMSTFNRGYSEMTFSRIAVLTEAREAIIHKEFHLSSADPRIVGEDNAVPIGRTNYDVADQLANLGMEAIHPKAAKGLRKNEIPLRVKNTFEPEHAGTLITHDYVSDEPCVEIIAGCKGVYAIELFDQEMAGDIAKYKTQIIKEIARFKAQIISIDMNANTMTHYLATNLKTVKRICNALREVFPDADVSQKKVTIVSAIGSDMQISGILAKTVRALAEEDISILAVHQSMRQVDMQFIVKEADYELAIKSLHKCLVEVYDHGRAICLAG